MQYFKNDFLKDAILYKEERDFFWYQKKELWIKFYKSHITLKQRYHFYQSLQMIQELPTVCFLPCDGILINGEGILEGFAIEKIKSDLLFPFSKASPEKQIEFLQDLKEDLFYLSRKNLELTNFTPEQILFDQGFQIIEGDLLEFCPTHTFLESEKRNREKLKTLFKENYPQKIAQFLE